MRNPIEAGRTMLNNYCYTCILIVIIIIILIIFVINNTSVNRDRVRDMVIGYCFVIVQKKKKKLNILKRLPLKNQYESNLSS